MLSHLLSVPFLCLICVLVIKAVDGSIDIKIKMDGIASTNNDFIGFS